MADDIVSGSPAELPVDDGVSTLVGWYDAAEEASADARTQSERDRDYHDNKQWTAAESATLSKRKQPKITINRIKRKIDFLAGIEKKQRANPKGLPRTPKEEESASAATDSIKFVIDDQQYNDKRSQAWRNILIEGAAGMEVCIENKKAYGEPCVVIRRTSWDRMFWDPHSSAADFSDAMYLGVVVWMDIEEAKATYGEIENVEAILNDTLRDSGSKSETYDDKPKTGVWADRKRKRIKIVQMYFRPDGQWYYAEFTKSGVLKGGQSPYLNEDQEPECPYIFQSAYVDRENNRFGLVREMISPQDEINKRRSKLLHQLNTRQVRWDKSSGGVDNIEEVRKELAKPDGVVEATKDGIEVLTMTDQITGQFNLLQEAKNEIDLMGPNPAMLGEAKGSPSGRAILANQQGGMIELGDLMDGLRHMDQRVYRAVWNRIRQFWTAEKWIRVTDDEKNLRFVGLNAPKQDEFGQPIIDPMTGQPELQNVVAQLDVDISVEDGPDGLSPMIEQFNSLVELKKADPEGIPTEMLIEAAPNLRNKERILAQLEERRQAQQDPEAAMIMKAGAKATVEETQSKTKLNKAKALEALVGASKEAATPIERPQPTNVYPLQR